MKKLIICFLFLISCLNERTIGVCRDRCKDYNAGFEVKQAPGNFSCECKGKLKEGY